MGPTPRVFHVGDTVSRNQLHAQPMHFAVPIAELQHLYAGPITIFFLPVVGVFINLSK